jgi:hypothetical protein
MKVDSNEYPPSFRKLVDQVRASVTKHGTRRLTVLSAVKAKSSSKGGTRLDPLTVNLPPGRYRLFGIAGALRVPTFVVDLTEDGRTVTLAPRSRRRCAPPRARLALPEPDRAGSPRRGLFSGSGQARRHPARDREPSRAPVRDHDRRPAAHRRPRGEHTRSGHERAGERAQRARFVHGDRPDVAGAHGRAAVAGSDRWRRAPRRRKNPISICSRPSSRGRPRTSWLDRLRRRRLGTGLAESRSWKVARQATATTERAGSCVRTGASTWARPPRTT